MFSPGGAGELGDLSAGAFFFLPLGGGPREICKSWRSFCLRRLEVNGELLELLEATQVVWRVTLITRSSARRFTLAGFISIRLEKIVKEMSDFSQSE